LLARKIILVGTNSYILKIRTVSKIVLPIIYVVKVNIINKYTVFWISIFYYNIIIVCITKYKIQKG